MRLLRTSMLLALVLAAFSGAAFAQAPPATGGLSTETDAMTDKAKELFKEGNKLYREQKWAQAEAAYEAAWALTDKKSKGLVNNLGQTEMHLGKYREAAEHLTAARRLAAPGDKQIADIERDLAEAKKKVGTLSISVNIEGAQLLVGDTVIGKTPLVDPVFVDPGKVTLTVLRDGYAGMRREVDVTAGKEELVVFFLKEPPPAPSVTATAAPSATATAVPPPPRSKVPAFVMGGAAIVALGVGGGLLGSAPGKADEGQKLKQDILDAKHSCVSGAANYDAKCKDVESTTRTADTLNHAGIGLLIGGGVLAAGAVAWWLWPQAKPASSGMRVVPIVSANGGGLVATGSW